MKVASSWINKWLRRTMLDGREIAEALELAGIEVEQIIESTQFDKNIIVAVVKKVVQHPGADRLKLVQVETGEGSLKIVCGAPNVREGMKVALAQIGSVLPSGDKIEKVKLRGEPSEGMLCSERELGLGQDHDGILELTDDVTVGAPLCDIYPADVVIDVKTPANRFDVLSIAGLAREVAAIKKLELAPLPTPLETAPGTGPAVEKLAKAGRYMLARVKVDAAKDSPRDVQSALKSSGVRSLRSVVDVTNFVMLELGQPLHAFDAGKVKLPVTVRNASTGEYLTTLDGMRRELGPQDLVIADQTGPIALAGVMGGASTEVDSGTTEVLLEAAVFDPVVVRKMAKRHNLRTEGSARFERGLPVELPPIAMRQAVEMLERVAGGKLVAITDQQNQAPTVQSITLPLSRLVKLLGFVISHKEATEALTRLQISVGGSSKDQIVLKRTPWWRPDLRVGEDLVEEVVRVVGYDKVPSTIPPWRPQRLEFDRMRPKRRRVRELMYAAGLFEVLTYSFVSTEQLYEAGLNPDMHLKLKNPLSSEQTYLRSTLLPSHLAVLARNRTYAKEVGFYEISNVFVKLPDKGAQPDEPLRLGVTVRRQSDAYSAAKGILDALARELNLELRMEPDALPAYAPGRIAQVQFGGKSVGVIGQIHPELLRGLKLDGEAAHVELDLAPLLEASTAPRAVPAQRFPAIRRDLAVLVPTDVNWQMVHDVLAGLDAAFVSDYAGGELPTGYKGMTVRLTLSHPERTPTEAEAVDLEKRSLKLLERKLGAKPRD